MRRKRKFILPFFLAGALLIGSASAVFASSGADLIKEYEYKADTTVNPSYDAPERLKEGGKTYELTDIKYEIVRDNFIEVEKTVKLSDKNKLEKTIDHELADGSKARLTAESNISWSEATADGIIRTQEYKNRSEIPEQITGTKPGADGEEIEITLKLSDTENLSRTENFAAPATFYAPSPDATKYQFNGKTVTISGSPVWSSYKSDVKDYLGINGNDYQITGGSWSSDFTKQGDKYVRTARYTGTKTVPFFRATYTETDDTTKIYTANVKYTGTSGKAVIKAIASYDRVLGAREYIMIGVGVLILAIAAAAILFIIGKRRRRNATT